MKNNPQKIDEAKKKEKNFINDHKAFTIIALVVFFLFVVPPIINWVVTAPSWFDALGFINDDNRNAWIGFYGAIIGGGITLGGVAWTISNQNKKRLDDASASIIANNYESMRQESTQKNAEPYVEITFRFNIKNIGKTKAINVNFKNRHLFLGVGKENLVKEALFAPISYTPSSILDTREQASSTFTIQLDSKNTGVLTFSKKDILSVTNNYQYALSLSYDFDVEYEDVYSRSHLIKCHFNCLIGLGNTEGYHMFLQEYYHKTIY